jgi:hypothetical protein
MRLVHCLLLLSAVGYPLSAVSHQQSQSPVFSGRLPIADSRRPAADDARAHFREHIKPILTEKCLTCHAGEKPKGKLDLSRRERLLQGGANGGAVTLGKPAESLLLEKLSAREMPPQNPLNGEQIAAFRKWIELGAVYEGEPLAAARKRAGPDWWSLQPIRATASPKPNGGPDASRWVRTPIDAFVLAKLEAAGLRPAAEADRGTLIRRATFDLLGLPPTPEEVHAFVNDERADAYERLIDRLLASPHYGERWGRHWLDVVRFGESHGYETNLLRPNAWPYRDYVIRALNRDMPYPRFILEQLAGDVLTGDEVDLLTRSATGFLVGGVHDVVGDQTPEGTAQRRMDDLDDIITATSTAFLGLTVNCARCHDHKFDPISQQDYYGLQAILAGVQHTDRDLPAPDIEERKRRAAEATASLGRVEHLIDALEPHANTMSGHGKPVRGPVIAKRNVDRIQPTAARFVRFTVLATNSLEPCIDELEVFTTEPTPRNIALASHGTKPSASSVYPNSEIHRLAHINDGRHGNGRSWISNEPSKGWVQLELPGVCTIDRIVWGRDREEKYKDRVPIEYRIEVAVEPEQWRLVASSADRVNFGVTAPSPLGGGIAGVIRASLLARQAELRGQVQDAAPTIKVYAGTFTAPGPTHVLQRGDPMKKGEAVKPSGLAALRPPLVLDANLPEAERRVALARWLGHPDNPLPARVMVNRVWHYHFGRGLVATPSDFGLNGSLPSHPELLDWLAQQFISSGWRLKPIHRLIMTSAVYRQSSDGDTRGASVDAENKLLWRFPSRRLEAEALRDAILATSRELDLRMGGPGYNLWEKNTNYVVVFKPKEALGPDEFRRMVYQFKPRTQQDPTFGAFDCPDAALVMPRRNTSTTALQALNLLNSRFVVLRAEAFADRLRREVGNDPEAQAERGFWLAFGRAPNSVERRAAVQLIRTHGGSAFCRAIYNSSEFVYVR